MSSQNPNVKAFKCVTALNELERIGDAFGIGDDLVAQVEEGIDKLVDKGEEWAVDCVLDWAGLKTGVPWLTGNLSESIQYEDGIKEYRKPYFWVGVNLDLLLGPKTRTVTNYVDYPKRVGQSVQVADFDYTIEPLGGVNQHNRTGPDKFIESVWWVTAERNLSKVMK